ncbi:MAG: hypothetical protein LUQ14_03845 [Methanomassiliicoccales archaeon]|nr:hypothetical protein [Methanomassiliicoccales archaeon]
MNNNVPSSVRHEEERERMKKDAVGLFRLTNGGRYEMEKKREVARANLYVIGMVR